MNRTVTALSPTDLEAFRKALKSRPRITKSQDEARFQKAWTVARRAVAILKQDFGVKKVVAFGSLTQPALFHKHSDVDLAVWGLAERDYYRAVGILQGLDDSIEVDLIEYESASDSMQATIQQGTEL
jgi:predicted nucleotidyltransferase